MRPYARPGPIVRAPPGQDDCLRDLHAHSTSERELNIRDERRSTGEKDGGHGYGVRRGTGCERKRKPGPGVVRTWTRPRHDHPSRRGPRRWRSWSARGGACPGRRVAHARRLRALRGRPDGHAQAAQLGDAGAVVVLLATGEPRSGRARCRRSPTPTRTRQSWSPCRVTPPIPPCVAPCARALPHRARRRARPHPRGDRAGRGRRSARRASLAPRSRRSARTVLPRKGDPRAGRARLNRTARSRESSTSPRAR